MSVSAEYVENRNGGPDLSYLICATPRSGSTLLCQALWDTGLAGRPAEHFEVLLETGMPRRPRDYFQRSNDPDVWTLLDDPEFRGIMGRQSAVSRGVDHGGRSAEQPAEVWRDPDFQDLLRRALEEGTTENGVFGTKIMWAYFRDFVRLSRRTPEGEETRPCAIPASVFPNFGGYVWIKRRDTVRQAVSLWRALQTRRWRRDSEEEAAGPDLRFNFAAIDHLKLRIDEHNAAWEAFFERCGAEPVKIVYEEFVKDYEATIYWLLDSLGISLPEDFTVQKPGMKKQSDSLSEEWVRMYHDRNPVGAAR